MTIKELTAFRNQIMDYYENKTNLEMLEKERPIIKVSRNPDYEDLKEALDSIDALAKESGFCDRILEEDILINIDRAVGMYNYPDDWDLSQDI